MAEVPSKRRLTLLQILAAEGCEMPASQMLEADPTLPRGTIYTTMQRLEKEGLVKSRAQWDEEGPRRLYRITALGQRMMRLGEMAQQVRAGKKLVPIPEGGI